MQLRIPLTMETLLRLTLIFVLISTQVALFGQDLRTFQEPLPCIDKKFTIVAHIVRDSFGNANITEDAINGSLGTLNTRFAPICVSFEICEFRYIDNFQYDDLDGVGGPEWAELQVKYHAGNRINIFYIFSFETEDDNACGFAGLSSITNLGSSGIVLRKDCLGSITHEMGHYFGLSHTFAGSGVELVDGSNCETAGDGVCDTPADPYVTNDPISDYVEDCIFINQKQDANGQFYSPDVGNTMSYYPSACECGFTHGQYLKMANTWLSSSNRMW